MPDSIFYSATRYASETGSSNCEGSPMLSFTNPTIPGEPSFLLEVSSHLSDFFWNVYFVTCDDDQSLADIVWLLPLLWVTASSSTLERKQLREEDMLLSFDGWALLQSEIDWPHQFDEVIKFQDPNWNKIVTSNFRNIASAGAVKWPCWPSSVQWSHWPPANVTSLSYAEVVNLSHLN